MIFSSKDNVFHDFADSNWNRNPKDFEQPRRRNKLKE